MAQIYIIKNKINKKVYIGKTEHNYLKRFEEHKADLTKRRTEKRPLYSAMMKYGKENFYVELIKETDTPEKDEIYFIQKYDSYKNGYNATLGGDGKKYINLDINNIKKEYLNDNVSVSFLANKYNVHQDTMTFYLKKEGIEIKTAGHLKRKRIKQLDIKSLKVINIFESTKIAAKAVGAYNASHIIKAANYKIKQATGFYWEYEEISNENINLVEKYNLSKLIQYKGGKCQACGYSKCEEALEFHHLNPETKSFNISFKAYSSLETLKIEADKCVLLCCNCHREIHDGTLKLKEEKDINIFYYPD